jgi:hypothetical protein
MTASTRETATLARPALTVATVARARLVVDTKVKVARVALTVVRGGKD